MVMKFKRLFLILGVILLSLIGAVGCSNAQDGNTTKDTIIKQKFFYTLQEAYTNSLLNIEDLEKIASYHNNGQQAKGEINNDIADEIKLTAAHNMQNDEAYADLNIAAEDFAITRYYGTYGNCIVFMIKNLCFESPAEDLGIIDVIAGVDFYYSSTDRIMVWKI